MSGNPWCLSLTGREPDTRRTAVHGMGRGSQPSCSHSSNFLKTCSDARDIRRREDTGSVPGHLNVELCSWEWGGIRPVGLSAPGSETRQRLHLCSLELEVMSQTTLWTIEDVTYWLLQGTGNRLEPLRDRSGSLWGVGCDAGQGGRTWWEAVMLRTLLEKRAPWLPDTVSAVACCVSQVQILGQKRFDE